MRLRFALRRIKACGSRVGVVCEIIQAGAIVLLSKNGSFRLIFLRVAAEFTGREKYKTPSRAHGCLRRAGREREWSRQSRVYNGKVFAEVGLCITHVLGCRNM